MITHSELKEILKYNPDTGEFHWATPGPGRRKNIPAGYIHKNPNKSYIRIGIGKKNYLAHRLAFLYMTGNFPSNEVDHIDGNGTNNSYKNLRCVTSHENSKNIKKFKSNTSGTCGVFWYKNQNRWIAKIGLHDKEIYLGSYENKQDAIAAREAANKKYNFTERHGR